MKYKTRFSRILYFGIMNVPVILVFIYLYANYEYYTSIEKFGKSYKSIDETYQYMISVLLICLVIYIAHRLMSKILVTVNEDSITTHQYS